MAGIKISELDHVHLYGADPKAAAAWYERVLGLIIHPSSVRRDPSSIVYLATPRGHYCASFFKGTPPSDGDHTSAFRVTGSVFIEFGDGLPDDDIMARDGTNLSRGDAADHGLAWSYYFRDPDGNHLEITTYDHERVRRWFDER